MSLTYKTEIYDKLYALLMSSNTSDFLVENNMVKPAYFGLWYGQDEEPESFAPIKYPALLLDFELCNWVQRGGRGHEQQGLATVSLRVVQATQINTAKNATYATETDKMLAYSSYIHYVMKGFEGEAFGKFKRVADGTVRKDKSIYSEILRFEVSVTDNIRLANSGVVQGHPAAFVIQKTI